MSEVEIRNDITKKMKQRAKYRRNRRNRKTRYCKARWQNRKNSIIYSKTGLGNSSATLKGCGFLANSDNLRCNCGLKKYKKYLGIKDFVIIGDGESHKKY